MGIDIGLGLEVSVMEILVEQQSDGSWMAACRGPLRAIVVESDEGWAADLACRNERDRQRAEKLEKDNE